MAYIPLGETDIRALAPEHLVSRRSSRYEAENERRVLKDFATEDRKLLRKIYDELHALFVELKAVHHDRDQCGKILQRFIAQAGHHRVADLMESFGEATHRDGGDHCSRLVHDLRGGAFQALLLHLEMLATAPEDVRSIHTAYFLLRDHLKIMRSCVEDLDDAGFRNDAMRRDHDTALLVEKWSAENFHAITHPVRIIFNCTYQGTLCESCLEFGTLDRIVYNLMNNAAEYSADGIIHFGVFPMPAKNPENVRFVISNEITPEHRQRLLEAFPQRLGDLFDGGFSTGGHGIGTRICGDFCAQAYGLEHREAKEAGHFGAWLKDNHFVAWFHWPVAGH